MTSAMRRLARNLGPVFLFVAAVACGEDVVPPFANPVIRQRADPWVYRHTDGYYYFSASVPEYDRIEVRRATTIQGLGQAEGVVVWRRHSSGPMSANIWAPEIHWIDGKWYIYFAAAEVASRFNHRIYVLVSEESDPTKGVWREVGRVETAWSTFSLDATQFEHRGRRYLVWAQREPGVRGNSNLYIAELANPWTIEGTPVRISRPEYGWEQQGFWVNEGPAVLVKNGRVFLTYSASATDARYCMGLLTAPEAADLLDPRSWSKSATPVLQTAPEAGVYGPGHASFTTQNGYDILIYHARSYREIAGDPLFDPNRDTRAMVIRWSDEGTPRFEPIP